MQALTFNVVVVVVGSFVSFIVDDVDLTSVNFMPPIGKGLAFLTMDAAPPAAGTATGEAGGEDSGLVVIIVVDVNVGTGLRLSFEITSTSSLSSSSSLSSR